MYGLAGISIATALIPIANVYLTREIVNTLAEIQGTDETVTTRLTTRLITLIGVLIAVIVISELIDVISEWIRLGYTEIIGDEIQTKIHNIIIRADYKYFEIPTYQDKLYLATSGADDEFTSTIDNCFTLLRASITLLAMIAVIAGFSLWLPVAIAIASAPTLSLVLAQGRRDHQQRKELVPEERRASYYDWLIQASEAAAELRTYGLGHLFVNRYRSIRSSIRSKQLGLEKRQMVHRLGANFFGLCIMGGAMVFVIARAISGQASIGDVAMFYRTMKYSQEVGIEFVKGIGSLQRNAVYLTDFFGFLDTNHRTEVPAQSLTLPTRLQRGIEFRGVDFSYPGSDQLVLEKLNLKVPAGKLTAILGPNGSGKSTLIKLIACLYREYDGDILIDGKNLKQLTDDEVRQHVSILFQDPMEYHLSARENITIGNLEKPIDSVEIAKALRAAAAHTLIEKLPEREHTLLGKWLHDGQELSGGEWHRVATARSLVGQKSIIIMDEPTSSLDPWEEIQWTKRIKEHLKSQTVIIITHRISVARLADHICVMDSGSVIEEGSHETLIKREGTYAKVCI